MKYKVLQITYNYNTFQDIEECIWYFTTSKIQTNKGNLDILSFEEVEQNGQIGVEIHVNGKLNLGEYSPFSPFCKPVDIKTVAIMRRPQNIWLWAYMFNEEDQPVAAFCGTDFGDDFDSFSKYVKELNRVAEGSGISLLEDPKDNNATTDFIPFAEERVTDYILTDGRKYNGWGCYNNGQFVPHGCGKKIYPDFYVYGNFKNGVLNGPAINSHDHYMYTMFFKGNKGNGWGLCVNGGYLVEFGYYENSQLKTDLTDFVQWYYEGKLSKSDRIGESMMSMYTSKETKEVATLLIGYAPKKITDGITLSCMGFRFRSNGSVWVGTGNLNTMTGYYMHFKPNGQIDIGNFHDGILVDRMPLQNFIDCYFETQELIEDDLFSDLFNNSPKYHLQFEREFEREKYRNIKEPRKNFNYFTGNFEESDDLPF